MNAHRCDGWCRLGSLVAVGLMALNGATAAAVEISKGENSVEVLVRAALEAEVAGDSQRRDELLRKALELDPESAPARWQAGFVRVDKAWLSVDEAQRRWSADERLAQYRRLRDARAGTPSGELALARGCRAKKLEVEARIHWLRLLLFDPQNEESLKSLGMRWYHGELLTHDQIQQRQAGTDTAERPSRPHWVNHWSPHWVDRWRPLVAKWRRAIDQGSAEDLGASIREQWMAVSDEQGLAALDGIVCQASRLKKGQEETYRALSLKLVEVLDAVPEPRAMHALARYAVFHPSAEVRTAAADALAKRPIDVVVPWLLAGMRWPVGIEAIKPGDQVLSQHPVTGELAYKPVLQTTTRDPSPMIKVNLGSETIAATRGHPFWVAGAGWQMAKQLDAGAPLHGMSGAVSVAGTKEAPPAQAWYDFSYNLIVDDFHTYFVGQSRVLVHDNQLFANEQLSNPLPGLAAR